MKITLINGSARHELTHIGETAELSEALTGEQTLSFTVLPEDADYLSDTTVIEYDGQLYDPARIERSGNALGVFSTVYAEHISYRLNDPAYDVEEFSFAGSCASVLSRILNGTGLTAGTTPSGTLPAEYAANATRREILMTAAAMMNCELSFSGQAVNLVSHRGSSSRIDLLATDSVVEVGVSRDLVAGTTAYTVSLGRRGSIGLGDEVTLTYEPLGLDVDTRIIAIRYHPYNPAVCSIDVGDYVPSVLDTYVKTAEAAASAAKQASAASTAAAQAKQTADTLSSQLESRVDEYVNSETGKASIVESLHGEFATPADLNGYVRTAVLDTSIGQYIDGAAGTAKIVAAASGTFATQDALGNYLQKTELSTEIGQYIDGAAGTAKIISAVSGTYQKKSDMSGYVTTTNLNTSIGQYIDGVTGQAKIVSACSATYQKKTDMNGYATTSALSTLEQRVSSTESAITLSTSYSNNTIGTNVQALLQLVSNPNSSQIMIKADKINFTGFTTFLKASDLGSSGTTTIDGGRIRSGSISADYIDVQNLKIWKIYSWNNSLAFGNVALQASDSQLHVGSGASSASGSVMTDTHIRGTRIWFGNSFTDGVSIADTALKPVGSTAFTLGTSTQPWSKVYCTKLYIGGTEFVPPEGGSDFKGNLVTMGGSSSYYILCNTSRELRPYSTSTTYPCYLGTSSYYWHYAYIGSNTCMIGSSGASTSSGSKIGFFGTTAVNRQTLSTTTQNMSYTSATSSNYLTILNNLCGILKNKYGLIA